MALPASGPISVNQVAVEFSRANNMAAFYSAASGIPASGAISLSQFYGKSSLIPGQQIFYLDVNNGSNARYFTVPAGCTSISAVCVGIHADGAVHTTELRRGAVVLLSSETPLGNGVGGGDGGLASRQLGGSNYGGGGAGGYTGNGGNGSIAEWEWGTSGSGGGGAGGNFRGGPQVGGGVGLYGIGNNGAAEGWNQIQTIASQGSNNWGGPFVGGSPSGEKGGNLRWANSIPVTPGETITVILGLYPSWTGSNTAYGYKAYNAARIMWGGGRSYPSNALNM